MMPIKAFITIAMIMCFSISTAQAGFGRTSSYGFGGSNTPSGTTSSPQADSDGDGVPDSQDAFPNDASESLDTDNDGIGNVADLDDDNDGTPDAYDAFPLDLAEQLDTDSDGVGNNRDTDDDNDGVLDVADLDPLNPQVSRDNQPPAFQSAPATLALNTLSTGQILILNANDDHSSAVQYGREGANANLFQIDANNGEISLVSGVSLSVSQSPISLTVTASDAAGNTARHAISITVSAATPQSSLSFAALSGSDTPEQGTLQLPTVQGGSGNGAISYGVNSLGICQVDQNGRVTALAVGSCEITANKAGSGNYLSATTAAPYRFNVTQGAYVFNGTTYAQCEVSVRPCNNVTGRIMATKAFVERGVCDAISYNNGRNCPSLLDDCGYNNKIWTTYLVMREGTWYWRLSPSTSVANKSISQWRSRDFRASMTNDRPANITSAYPDDTYDSDGTHLNLCMRP